MDDLTAFILLGLRFGLALSLYAFLGWGLLTMWKDLSQQAEASTQRAVPPLHLHFVNHEDIESEPEILKISLPQVLIGRDPACECFLNNETVSSKHARLYFRLNQWWLEDLDSSNGTFLNEQPVTIPTVLTDGDQLRFGQAVVVISYPD